MDIYDMDKETRMRVFGNNEHCLNSTGIRRIVKDFVDCFDLTPQQRAVTLHQTISYIMANSAGLTKRKIQWFILDFVDDYKASWLETDESNKYLSARWEHSSRQEKNYSDNA